MKALHAVALCLGAVAIVLFGFWLWNLGKADPKSDESPSVSLAAAEGRAAEAIAGSANLQSVESAESLDCQSLLERPEINSRFLSGEKRLHVGAFLQSLADQGHSQLEQNLVADRAGLGRHSNSYASYASIYRNQADLLEINMRALPPLRTRFLSSLEQMQAEELLNDASLDALIQAARDTPSLLQARFLTGMDARTSTSVLGQFIRQRGPELYRSLDSLARSADLPLGLHELAVAIEQGASPVDFLGLLELSGADPRETWRGKQGGKVNLAVVAAMNLSPGILRLLIERGVNPILGRRSVLDELALALSPQPQQADILADVVSQLAIAGDRPFLPSTLAAFRQWLPKLPELELHPEVAAALQMPELEVAALELAALAAEWDGKVKAAVKAEAQCRETLLARAEDSSGGRDLPAKLRHWEALKQRESQQLEQALQMAERMKRLEADLDPDHLRELRLLTGQIWNAKNDGQWDEALRLVEEGRSGDWVTSTYAWLLSEALQHGAPLDVILTLVERSGSLPEDAILKLVTGFGLWDGAAEAAAELERLHGMDVHFIDDEGRNAFSFIAERFWQPAVPPQSSLNMNALEMTGFLLNRSVSVKPSPSGLDPLDSVLLRILDSWIMNPAGVIYARILIDHGAPIEASHLQLAKRISIRDPDGYERLIGLVPELSPKSSSNS